MLAGARPDAFQPYLAASLTNLSDQLASLGRREEARAPSEEASRIYREVAAARPGAFRSDLAMALNSLSGRLAGLGRREEALAPRGVQRHFPAAGRGRAGGVPPESGRLADQPVGSAGRSGSAGRGADRERGS